MVLGGELEVGERDGDTGGDAEQDTVDDKEDAVQRVLLTTPQRGEDVVQLHRDSTAGEDINMIIVFKNILSEDQSLSLRMFRKLKKKDYLKLRKTINYLEFNQLYKKKGIAYSICVL